MFATDKGVITVLKEAEEKKHKENATLETEEKRYREEATALKEAEEEKYKREMEYKKKASKGDYCRWYYSYINSSRYWIRC